MDGEDGGGEKSFDLVRASARLRGVGEALCDEFAGPASSGATFSVKQLARQRTIFS